MNILNSQPAYAKLYISVNRENTVLHNLYVDSIQKHNQSVLTNVYPNSGFDLFIPEEQLISSSDSAFISMCVKCEMRIYDSLTNEWRPTGYYSYPRSSISKTPLMLANSVGIIDSGYRGAIIGAFRNISSDQIPYTVEKHSRLLQICAPDLRPIIVELVNEQFFENTTRGSGGFGSTGK